jgi:hypothetical protein
MEQEVTRWDELGKYIVIYKKCHDLEYKPISYREIRSCKKDNRW